MCGHQVGLRVQQQLTEYSFILVQGLLQLGISIYTELVMARFHNIGGESVQFTSEEEATRDAEEAAWEEGTYNRRMIELRSKRNQKLADTDWWASSDLTMTADQTTYRKALRDLPASVSPELDSDGNLIGVTWPTKPE